MAAERHVDGAVHAGAVDDSTAGVELSGHAQAARGIVRDDAAGQAVGGLVQNVDALFVGIERDDREDRTEDLHILRDGHLTGDAGEDGWLEERLVEAFAAAIAGGTLFNGLLHLALDFLCGFFVDEAAEVGRWIEGIADLQLGEAGGELFGESVDNGTMDDIALGRAADLTGVVDTAADGLVHGVVEIGVVEDQDAVVAAELHDRAGHVLRGVLDDVDADGGAAGEADAVDLRRIGQRTANGAAAAGDDLQDLAGDTGLDHDLRHQDGAERCVGRGLHNDGVAGSQRRAGLVAEELNGEIEGIDTGDDAERLVIRHDQIIRAGKHMTIDVLGLLRIAAEELRGQIHTAHGLRDGLAGLGREQRRDFLLVGHQRVGRGVDELRALVRGFGAPDLRALLRDGQRGIDVLCRGAGNRVDQRMGDGIEHVDRGTAAGGHVLSAKNHFHTVCAPSMMKVF